MRPQSLAPLVFLLAAPVAAQTTLDPYPTPLTENGEPLVVDVVEFAFVPDIGEEPARLQHILDEPGSGRLFANDMRGPIYSIGYDGRLVQVYLDVSDPRWGVDVESGNFELGVQSFAFHPQFTETGTPGFGRLYTWVDTRDTLPPPDFSAHGGENPNDTVLLEWIAADPRSSAYDGGPPRELLRIEQPFDNHNGGQIGFDPTIGPGVPGFGLLYVAIADGGDGGDPLDLAQDLSKPFGKIFRIDPMGSDSGNGQYGIPAGNPFSGDDDRGALDEIYAYGLRNPQSFAWDPASGRMFLADIGQIVVEELNVVTLGANLGWNVWEGSYRFVDGEGVETTGRRSDPSITYPVAEYDQQDPILQGAVAASGVHVSRSGMIPDLEDVVLFGDNPGGEIFFIDADELPDGGQDPLGRILLRHDGETTTLLDLVMAKTAEQGRSRPRRVDMRMGSGSDGRVFLLNKQDGIIRTLVASPGP